MKFLLAFLRDVATLRKPVTAAAVASAILLVLEPLGAHPNAVAVAGALTAVGVIAAYVEHRASTRVGLVAFARQLLADVVTLRKASTASAIAALAVALANPLGLHPDAIDVASALVGVGFAAAWLQHKRSAA